MASIHASEIENLRRSAVMAPPDSSVPVQRDTLLALLERLQALEARTG